MKYFVSFLGPVRTGHTLIASLLSVHKQIAMSVEILHKKNLGKSSKEIINLILKDCKERTEIEKGGYSYFINKSQNKTTNLKVVGDSMAGVNHTIHFDSKKNVKDFYDKMVIPIKWIVVYRNPFDVVTSSHLMNEHDITFNLDHFIRTTKTMKRICKFDLVKSNLFVIHLEDFIENPRSWMIKLCKFLNVSASFSYLDLCCSKVFSKPNRVFNRKLWSKHEIERINRFSKAIPELRRYYNEF